MSEGLNIIVYDFDGHRTLDGGVTCLELTSDVLVEKINNTRFPFGHGYIVAASICGIEPSVYL